MTPLALESKYYEGSRAVRRASRNAMSVVASALTGQAARWALDRLIDGLQRANRMLEEQEHQRLPEQKLIRISSRFGMRFHPVLHRWRLHNGVDFAAPRGTPVRVVEDGVVLSAGWRGGAGRVVKVDHGTYVSGYAHLSKFNVHPGDDVKAGAVIGAVGASGLATGNHLHFMILKQGRFVDPLTDGIDRREPIDEIQVLVNIERGLGIPALLMARTAAALLKSTIPQPDLDTFSFDENFL